MGAVVWSDKRSETLAIETRTMAAVVNGFTTAIQETVDHLVGSMEKQLLEAREYRPVIGEPTLCITLNEELCSQQVTSSVRAGNRRFVGRGHFLCFKPRDLGQCFRPSQQG